MSHKGLIKMKSVLLKVKTGEGIFSNEYEVSFKDSNGRALSIFIDKTEVIKNGKDTVISVNSIDNQDETHNILLPSETLETFTRWVDIPKTEILM